MFDRDDLFFIVLGEPNGWPGFTNALDGLSLLRTPVKPVEFELVLADNLVSVWITGAEAEEGRPMPIVEVRLGRTGTTDVEIQLLRGLLTGLVCVILLSTGLPGNATNWPDNRLGAVDGRALGGAVVILDVGGLALIGWLPFSLWVVKDGGGADISSENRSSFVTDRVSSRADSLIESILFFNRVASPSVTPRLPTCWYTFDIECRLGLVTLGSIGLLFFHS